MPSDAPVRVRSLRVFPSKAEFMPVAPSKYRFAIFQAAARGAAGYVDEVVITSDTGWTAQADAGYQIGPIASGLC